MPVARSNTQQAHRLRPAQLIPSHAPFLLLSGGGNGFYFQGRLLKGGAEKREAAVSYKKRPYPKQRYKAGLNKALKGYYEYQGAATTGTLNLFEAFHFFLRPGLNSLPLIGQLAIA